MLYTAVQIGVWICVAFLVGWIIGFLHARESRRARTELPRPVLVQAQGPNAETSAELDRLRKALAASTANARELEGQLDALQEELSSSHRLHWHKDYTIATLVAHQYGQAPLDGTVNGDNHGDSNGDGTAKANHDDAAPTAVMSLIEGEQPLPFDGLATEEQSAEEQSAEEQSAEEQSAEEQSAAEQNADEPFEEFDGIDEYDVLDDEADAGHEADPAR